MKNTTRIKVEELISRSLLRLESLLYFRRFGLRRQSEAATPLWIRPAWLIADLNTS